MRNKDKIKELENKIERILDHLKIEVSFWKEGVWYTDGGKAKVRYSKDGCIGYALSGNWAEDIYMGVFEKSWREMTDEEITTTLNQRCVELGLFEGEFECLTGKKYSDRWDVSWGNRLKYDVNSEKFWVGNNLVYKQGKFAKKSKTVEERFLEELTERLSLDTREDYSDFKKWLDGFEIKKREEYEGF